jgi:hypothetical protein
MTLAPGTFASGALRFAQLWSDRTREACTWRWQSSPSAFGVALVIPRSLDRSSRELYLADMLSVAASRLRRCGGGAGRRVPRSRSADCAAGVALGPPWPARP